MPAACTVVVTRPGEPGRRLAGALREAGQPALWLPAFEFGPPIDEMQARLALASLATFDLAVFVSPQAARATGALFGGAWPADTAISAVGSATRDAVLATIDGSERVPIIAPADEEDGAGSEALWPLLRAMQPPPRRVLVLRAESGREWLAERLRQAGAVVQALAVYSRRRFEPPQSLRDELAAAASPALLVSSSDAVEALRAMFASQPALLQAMRDGPALATHRRIEERLREAGFRCVVPCAADAQAIIDALRQACSLESGAPGGTEEATGEKR